MENIGKGDVSENTAFSFRLNRESFYVTIKQVMHIDKNKC